MNHLDKPAAAAAPVIEDIDSEDDLPPIKDSPTHPYFVIKQDVELELNFRAKRIDGKSHITFAVVGSAPVDELAIDARQSEIDVKNITLQVLKDLQPVGPPKKVSANYTDPYKLLDYPKHYGWNAEHHDLWKVRMNPIIHTRQSDVPAENRETVGCTPVDGSLRINLRGLKKGKEEPGAGVTKRPTLKIRVSSVAPSSFEPPENDLTVAREYRVTIPFKTKLVRDGIQFVGVDPGDLRYPHAYTRHSIEPGTASCIFPCIDDHGQLCTWSIAVKCPRTLGDALWQPLATQQRTNGHANTSRDRAHASHHHKSDRDFSLTEEDKLLEMTVVCSGSLSDEVVDPLDERKKIMTFEMDKRVSVQKIGFAVGPFEHVDLFSDFRTEENDEKLGASALKIHGYCLPGRAAEVQNTCAALAAAADFFTLTFARYPFESYKMCFLDDMVNDTVALQSLSFVSTRLLFPEDIIDPEVDVTRQLAFSLASQWSGINLFPNTRRDLWVVIGIAYYMTDLFLKKLCGNNDYRFRMKTMSDRLVNIDVKRPSLHELGNLLHIGNFEMEFMALKAPLILFILDKRLMKAPAQTNLTRIISRILYKANVGEKQSEWIINTESFQRVCEKNARNKLEAFWSQWVYGSGCPRFDVYQRFNKKRLCVEMTIKQVQDKSLNDDEAALKKTEFLRAIKEKFHRFTCNDTAGLFTGPMTIRIHEADGTPYEHIVEIREDAAKVAKFEIPYNTKYKRLKRKRRATEKLSAQSAADPDDNEDKLLYSLGDVLNSAEDLRKWELAEWEPEIEKAMDQESYEWIRMDADFEWACEMKTNLQSYMYVSQLQQDRDVVAQQDSMLYLRKSPPHPLVSTFLTRTLVDRRYFHGIRTMAAETLHQHATEKVSMTGMNHILRAFSELFCFPDTQTPRPNDFTDKKQYIVQSALPMAIAKVRDSSGKCPERARRFLLDQVQFNNNANNMYSDHFYVAKLLDALATSLVPEKRRDPNQMDLDMSLEERSFLGEALVEIDRFRRMDEWANSYQNIWTTTALECKRKLMKAGVIPKSALDFIQYLQDETCDLVRIKAFEALVDLGYMMEMPIFRLILSVISTDKSPFVRDKLLHIFSSGLAGLAFGDLARPKVVPVEPELDVLIVDADVETQERKRQAERKKDINVAIAALKTEMEEQYSELAPALQRTVWKAINSKVLGRAEKITLLEFCGIMFDAADRWMITLNLPKGWRVTRPVKPHPGRCVVNFKSYYKTSVPQPKAKEPEKEREREREREKEREKEKEKEREREKGSEVPVAAPTRPPEPKRLIVNMKSGTAKLNKPLPSASAAPRPLSTVPRPSPSPAAQSPVPSAAPSPTLREADSIVASSTKAGTLKPSIVKPSVVKPSVVKPSVPKPSLPKPLTKPPLSKPPLSKLSAPKPPLPKPSIGKPSVAKPVVPSGSMGAQQNGRSTPQPSDTPSSSSSKSQKRPRPDKIPGVDDASPVLKKAKLNVRPDGTPLRRRRMFRFRHPNLKSILKKAGVVSQMPPPKDPSQIKPRKATSPLSVRPSPVASPATLPSEGGSIMAKPARKPLPGGSGGGSAGPTTSAPAPSKPPSQASPPPPESQPAPKRVKVVIKKPSSSVPK